jgi:calcineurin-like phosphoesterase family protein
MDICKYVIHGHIHNKNPDDWEPDGLKRINVCIDYKPNNYYPLELNIPKIRKYFKNLKY